jgi:CelD/BcsL family acetyltransferase involved in cellulose biosynthesis
VKSRAAGSIKFQCRSVRPSELTDFERSQWKDFRAANSVYASPFFSLEFAEAASEIRPDAKVAILENEDGIVGFLPYQGGRNKTIVPIGGAYNDLHGILGRAETRVDFRDVIQAIGPVSFRFHALADLVSPIQPYTFGTTRTFLADLASHPEGYVQFLEHSRKTVFKQRKKTRKMIKDLGPVRLEFDCRDPKVLDQVIQLKRDQYRRTYIFDLLSVAWARGLLHAMHARSDGGCRGLLSVLYAGDTLVAGHYGMLEGPMMHYWFPVYDEEYHQYSPGTALFLEVAQAATEAGVRKIDFGYGEQPYKVKLTDTIGELPFGRVDISRMRWWRCRCQTWLAQSRSSLPFKDQIKPWIRRLVPNLDGTQYHQ